MYNVSNGQIKYLILGYMIVDEEKDPKTVLDKPDLLRSTVLFTSVFVFLN